jgi:hypothetical protein
MECNMRTSTLATRALLGLLITLAVGCAGEGSASPGLKAEIETVSGIEHYRYPEAGATTLSWTFDTIAVIGGFTEDDPNKQFGGVRTNSLASDAAGNLYVLDNQGKRIIGYSSTGEVIGIWGREGEGPGEIGGGSGMLAMAAGDTLWLADGSNQRITLFPTDGGDATAIPLNRGAKLFRGSLKTVSSGALVLLNSISASLGKDMSMPPPRTLVLIARDGAITDTVWIVPAARLDLVSITGGDKPMVLSMFRRFSPNFSYGTFSDGGLVLQDQAAYDFRMLAADGTVERVVQREPEPRPTTDEDRQHVIDEMLERSDEPKGDVIKQAADATTFYDIIPRINMLRVDKSDRIWVGVSETTPEVNDRVDVYSRDAQLVGELYGVDLPDLFFGDGYAALIAEDELEVQQIVLLRLIATN